MRVSLSRAAYVKLDLPDPDYLDAGAAYGTAKAGVGIGAMGVMKPEAVMKNIIPVVMAGVIGIYGLIVAVLLVNNGTPSF